MTKENLKPKTLPKHVAIIMDGNRRWAKERDLPTMEGHRRGAANFEKLVNKSRELGIQCLSAWAFSTENWARSKEEVTFLFKLIEKMIKRYKEKCVKEKIRFVHLGRKDRIPESLSKIIADTEEKTRDFTNFIVCLAIDYGGHDELIRTVNKVLEKNLGITPENVEKNLDTSILPQIDLVIRTGGEKRLSGFMSWQCAYAELYFTDTYFPSFGTKELEKAIKDFGNRERRFGGN